MTVDPRAVSSVSALSILLTDAIDYAGLFPPAQLDMSGAVAEYAAYLQSPDRWALGRFVVPAARLDELSDEGESLATSDDVALGSAAPWRLSALLGNDLDRDLRHVRAFNSPSETPRRAWHGRVNAVEVRGSSAEQIAQIAGAVGTAFECYIEVPIAGDPAMLIRAIGSAGARAKVRTGGTTADAFPSSEQLVRFIAACVSERVRFKATAGLHHPLRGDYALTYDESSARGTMFGFLNVFLAVAFLEAGATEATARAVLEERSKDAFRFDDAGVTWGGQRLSRDQLASSRLGVITSFGSCSFREPIDDLASLGRL